MIDDPRKCDEDNDENDEMMKEMTIRIMCIKLYYFGYNNHFAGIPQTRSYCNRNRISGLRQ